MCGNYYCYKVLLLLSCSYSHKANDRMVYFVNVLNKVDKYVLQLQNRVVKKYRSEILKRNFMCFKDSEAVRTSC